MDGGLESHCVGRVCGADGAVRHHPHRTYIPCVINFNCTTRKGTKVKYIDVTKIHIFVMHQYIVT